MEEMNRFGGLTSTALLLLITNLSSSPMLLLVHGLSSSPSPPSPSTKNYCSYKTFKRLGVPALVYSAFSRATAKLTRTQPKAILPKKKTSRTEGKVAIVTGSNTGVGFETAKSLVQEHGMQVIIACRSMEKGLDACDKINGNLTNTDMIDGKALFVQPLDLADLDSVRGFGQAILEKYETIDVLVNNAGRNSAGESDKRKDSLDVIFTTNFLGHFLLTNLLLEKCRRIVNLASVMHHFPKNDKSDNVCAEEYWRNAAIEPGEGESDVNGSVVPRKTYSASKLAALFFSIELNRRFGERTGIRSIAVNPGSVNSDIWRNYPSYMQRLHRFLYLTAEQGSSTSVAAAVLDFPPETIYLQPYHLPPSFRKKNRLSPPFPMFEMLGPYAGYVDTKPRLPDDDIGVVKACESLFTVCEELAGCKFEQS